MRSSVALSLLTVLLLPAPFVWAGPIAEFNRQSDAAYGAYRQALFDTNTGKAEESARSVAQFLGRWDELAARYGTTPPPQYAEDPHWRGSLDEVGRLGRDAQAQVRAGKLPDAHETLEQVRDVLSLLRRRNGIVAYSDFINEFHEHMEHVLKSYPQPLRADAIGMLREDTAVLRALTGQLKVRAPEAYAREASFQESLTSLQRVVERLQEASRAANPGAVGEALKALKPAFAKLFVRWG